MNVIILKSFKNKIHGIAGNYLWRIHSSIYIGKINRKIFCDIYDYMKLNMEKDGLAIFLRSTNNEKGFEILYINELNSRVIPYLIEESLLFIKK